MNQHAHDHHAHHNHNQMAQNRNFFKTYYPLFLILFYLLLISFLTSINDFKIIWPNFMANFMAGFFIVFSAFKLLDLRGFANAYADYDILAKRSIFYAYLYPFLELALGVLYVTKVAMLPTNIFTIVLMAFSSIGVLQAVLAKRQIQCACLGVVLNLPISNITIFEDFLMIVMAIAMLIMH